LALKNTLDESIFLQKQDNFLSESWVGSSIGGPLCYMIGGPNACVGKGEVVARGMNEGKTQEGCMEVAYDMYERRKARK
jgi:hypothetical protein